MEADEIYRILKKSPFEPFCVFVSDGSRYEIRHPEQLLLSKRTAHVGMGPNGDGPFQRVALVSLVHVTRVEPLKRIETDQR